MKRRIVLFTITALGLMVTVLITARPAAAQPILVDANPAPASILPAAPQTITLTFDRALIEQGSSIRVTGGSGDLVETGDARVDPINRAVITAALPLLVEGTYTVTYTALGVGNSTVLVGAYQFTVDLPPPRLALLEPVDGQAYQTGTIPLKMQVDYFEFSQYENRIRVYVDGNLEAELRSLDYELIRLEPGVHEIRTVLAQFEDQELPETTIIVNIAVAQPNIESGGKQSIDDTAHTGARLTFWQTSALVLLGAALLLLGIWLGKKAPS